MIVTQRTMQLTARHFLWLSTVFSCFSIAFITTVQKNIRKSNSQCCFDSVVSNFRDSVAFTISRANLHNIFEVAYLITHECVGGSLNDAVFNLRYLKELNRLRDNFDMINDSDHQCFVATNTNNMIVGYADCDRRQHVLGHPVPYISDVIVSCSFRRQGVATALLQSCFHTCKHQWNESCTYLWSESTNLKGLTMYGKLGFSLVSAEKGPLDDVSQITRTSFSNNGFKLDCHRHFRNYEIMTVFC